MQDNSFHLAYAKAFTKIVASLKLKLFCLVIDKRTWEKPQDHEGLTSLAHDYLIRAVNLMLAEEESKGMIVIAEGHTSHVIKVVGQITERSAIEKQGMLPGPLFQPRALSVGLQVAEFVAVTSRKYHETTYPKLFAKQILEGYDAVINSHYQGFVKPNTWVGNRPDVRGFLPRGYIYLWRRKTEEHSSSHTHDGVDHDRTPKRSFGPTRKAFT